MRSENALMLLALGAIAVCIILAPWSPDRPRPITGLTDRPPVTAR